MFTLKLVDLEYETSVSLWEFEMLIVQNDSLPSFHLSTRLNSKTQMKLGLLMNSDKLIVYEYWYFQLA